ncbi:condensation domain-containing protein [Candidatus Leptofilum sp.]|uniref:condensation domain-containing protein n=1 Tax=Candidatus Leptofilum sp. TaxID=3241576 RepID=UPI003B5CE250
MQASTTVENRPSALPEDIYTNSNLTKLQMIYWVGQSLRPNTALFNVVVTFRWQAPVDEAIFAEAFAKIVEQSDALRTVIREEAGVPKRIVLDAPPQPLQLLDFSNEANPEEHWHQWVEKRRRQRLDLGKCAYDVVLVKLAEADYCWFVNQHHLVSDAASFYLVYDHVMAHYFGALESDQMGALPQLPTFESFYEFEQGYRTSPRYQKSAAYWQKALADGVEPLKFYGRSPKKKSHNVQRIRVPLDVERSQQIKDTVQRPGVIKMTHDLGMLNVLLTLYFAQLHIMTGNDRLATMMPFHNRPTEAMKQTIGLLMEIAPLLVTFEEGETFASLTKKISKSLQRTLVHYQYGSAVALQNNLLDLMFNFHHRPELHFGDAPVTQELVHPGVGSDSFALHIHEFEADGALTFFFDFHEDVFTLAERELTLDIFEKLLGAYLANSELPLKELNLPTAVFQTAVTNDEFQNGTTAPAKAAFVAPRDALEQQLADAWQAVLGVEKIGILDDFFDLGGNSWTAVRLFTELQSVTGRNLPLATLFQAPTIAALANLMRQGGDRETWTSLVPIRSKGSKPPFFCIHGVTGDILWLKDLADLMDDDQPFYGIQARGLDGEAEPFDRLDEMAAYYLQQIRQVQPTGPYYLGGYCMGGDIAYEVARQLQAAGEEVPILTVIDPPPADLSERAPLNGRFLIDFVRNSPYWLREFMRLGGGEIASRIRRKGRVALRSLWQKARSQSVDEGVTATDVIDQADDLPEYRQKLIESHIDALQHYTHAGYDGEVIVYEAQSRPLLNPGNHANEWIDYVNRPITVRTVSGSHSSMLHKPHVIQLAQDLQDSLDQVRNAQKMELER